MGHETLTRPFLDKEYKSIHKTIMLENKVLSTSKNKKGRWERNFYIDAIFIFVDKMYGNGLKVQRVDKHLFWIYLGARIMQRKLSSPNHVSAIELNLREK